MLTPYRLLWLLQSLHLLPAGVAISIALCAGCQSYSSPELPDALSPRLVIRTPQGNAPSRERDQASSSGQLAKNGLWARLGHDAALWNQVEGSDRVDEQLKWLIENRSFLTRASGSATPYLHFIVQSLEQRGLPPELALLPMIESAYNPTAVSHRNAVGLWQFMPATATDSGLRRTASYDGRRDVMASTTAAMDYLQRLYTVFDGDWLLALAAYNAGEGTVGRAMDTNRRKGLPTDYWHLQLPRETAEYVPRLLALSAVMNAPEAHGISLRPVLDEPYFAQVRLSRPVDLKQVANASGIPELVLRQLNPAYLQGTTQGGPGHLLVPVAMQQPVMATLDASPDDPAVSEILLKRTAIAVTQMQP
jgi:membrane-bound lytic murein transglycosylase D